MKTLKWLKFLLLLSPHVLASQIDYAVTLNSAASIIKHQFYDAKIGEQVAKEITSTEFQQQFYDIEDKQEFADRVSSALRQISKDNHIGIVYSPSDVERYMLRDKAKSNSEALNKSKQNYAAKLAESRQANFGIQQLRILEGHVGYIELAFFDGFVEESAPVYANAMSFLDSAKVIIIDLRRNGGGNSRILPLFLGYFLGPEPVHFATKTERWKNQTTRLYTDSAVEGTRFVDKPIYVLTSGTTFSLAEHVTYHLKAFNRAKVVGERTYGGGRAFDPVVLDSNFYLRIPRIEMTNAKTGKMYQEGFGITPDILVSADRALTTAYLDALAVLENQVSSNDELQYYQWVRRIVSAQTDHQTIMTKLPNVSSQQRFDEYRFENRDGHLWMSYRSLPWVKLITLANGYFFDDRSIQRQFKFVAKGDTYELHILKPWQQNQVLIQSN